MIVQKLTLQNFKNHPASSFSFSAQINCFTGNNGAGKTNILDALYYLSVGKSFLGNADSVGIYRSNDNTEQTSFFSIEAEILNDDKTDIVKIIFPRDGKKIIKRNDKTYDKLADYVGFLPNVVISPYDSNLISDSGESRRKFLDAMISQTDKNYLHSLIQYQKTLQQRNALLKYFAKNRNFDADSLEIYTKPLISFGTSIYEKRRDFVESLQPAINTFYEEISGGKEIVSAKYQSHLSDNHFEQILISNLDKDRINTYTTSGIHKDDVIFEMNGHPLKKFGSQGQQKSFLISLKLAQVQRIREITGKNPILLLDDIFDKLDDERVSHLIKIVNDGNFGQIFLTDTHRERTASVISRITEDAKIFEILS